MIKKIECEHCGGAIEFELEDLESANQKITCPHCGQQTALAAPARSEAKPEITTIEKPLPVPSVQPNVSTGHKIRKGEFAGVSALVQAAGLVVILAGWALGSLFGGFVIGFLLFIIGSIMARKLFCSNCGNKISGAEVRICPVCKCQFQDRR